MSKHKLYVFTLCTSAFLILMLLFGSYAETYTSFELLLQNGSLVGEPLKSYISLGYIGIDNLFYHLYLNFKNIQWAMLYHFASLLVSFMVIAFCFFKVLKNRSYFFKGIFFIYISVLFYSNIQLVNITRESILLAFSSVILIICNNNRLISLYLISFVLLTLSILNRPESAFLALSIFSVIAFLLYFYRKIPLRSFLNVLMAGLYVLIVFICVLFFRLNNNEFYLSSDFEQYTIGDSGFDVRAQTFSKTDSMTFVAFQAYFLNDTSIYNNENMQRIFNEIELQHTNNKFISSDRIRYALVQVFNCVKKSSLLLLIGFLLLFFYRSKLLLVSVPFLSFVFFAIAYFIKMEIWIFDTIFLCFILMFLLFQLNTNTFKILLIIMLHLPYSLYNYNNIKKHQIEENKIVESLRQEIGKFHSNKILVLDVFSSQKLLKNIFDTKKVKFSQKIFLYDMGQLPLVNQYSALNNNVCNCNSLSTSEVLDFYKLNKDEIIFISNDNRLQLLSDFWEVHYDRTFSFTPVKSIENQIWFYSIYPQE